MDGNNKIFLSEPISLYTRVWMILFGILQIISGSFNYSSTHSFAMIQIGAGIIALLYFLFVTNQLNRDLFISWNEEEIIFRIKLFKGPIHIKWNEIANIKATNNQLVINYYDGCYVLKYSDLTYLQRKNNLPLLLDSIRIYVDDSRRKL